MVVRLEQGPKGHLTTIIIKLALEWCPNKPFTYCKYKTEIKIATKKKHLLPFYICSRYPRPACQHPFFPHLAKKIQSILEIAFSLLLVSEVSCKQNESFCCLPHAYRIISCVLYYIPAVVGR